MEAALGRGYQGRIRQTWTASERSLSIPRYPWCWESFLQRLNRTFDVALHFKPFLVLLTISNWFSLSPHSIFFRVHHTFASNILLQGSPVHVGLPSTENSCQKGLFCRKPEHGPAQGLDKTFVQTGIAFNPSVLSEHKQNQRDMKSALLRTGCVQAHTHLHTAVPLPRQPTFLLALASLHKNCKVTFPGQENGERECIEPGKVVTCSLGLSWNGGLQYFHCDKCIKISETDGNNIKFNSVPVRSACNRHIVSYCQTVIGCLILFVGKGWMCILNGLISLLT